MTKQDKQTQNVQKADKLIYFFAFTTPLFELPQLYSIIHSKSAEQVSLITWAYLAVASFAWLVYGIIKGIKPLIASYVLYTLVEFSIVTSILLYK